MTMSRCRGAQGRKRNSSNRPVSRVACAAAGVVRERARRALQGPAGPFIEVASASSQGAWRAILDYPNLLAPPAASTFRSWTREWQVGPQDPGRRSGRAPSRTAARSSRSFASLLFPNTGMVVRNNVHVRAPGSRGREAAAGGTPGHASGAGINRAIEAGERSRSGR